MISETQAIKQIVKRYRGEGRPRLKSGNPINGKTKKVRLSSSHSRNLGRAAATLIEQSGPRVGYWVPPVGRAGLKRLRKRIAKKLRQPHRRKDRGPLRARAAGKNEVTRR